MHFAVHGMKDVVCHVGVENCHVFASLPLPPPYPHPTAKQNKTEKIKNPLHEHTIYLP